MREKQEPEALKSPTSYNDDTPQEPTCAQAPNSGADFTSSTHPSDEVHERLSARLLSHQATPVTDGAAHERREFAPFGSVTHERRRDPVDEQCLSRAGMWDPVKDCCGPYATQANVSGFLPDRHNSTRLDHSKLSASSSIGLHLPHSDHPYGQARKSPQRFGDLGPRGIGLPLPVQSRYMVLPLPQSQAIASVRQVTDSMNSQPMQVDHPHDQLQHYGQQRPIYEGPSILHPHLRYPSGHIGLQSVTKGTDHAQENRQQDIGMGFRMPTSIASHESVQPWQSPSSTTANMSTQQMSGFQSASHHQRQSFFPSMSQATELAQYAERLDQQYNREEAMRVYERACALFQDVIIRSSSLQERLECDAARKACQARLDVLKRELAANPSSPPPGQNDQQDDDGSGAGKPQYSLYEDWALCSKIQEGLTWQEVADTSLFKGRRRHRSLSQRKHTIGRMGPKYHEVEEPWTEAENRRLCALGDAGKTLGEIHRKFRSRNAERCLDHYFHLKGYHSAGSSDTPTSPQARHAPVLRPHSPESMQDPSLIPRHSAYGVHPGPSISETGSHGQSIDTALQQTNQRPTVFSPSTLSAFTRESQKPQASGPHSPLTSAEPLGRSTGSLLSNNAASPRPPATRFQGPSNTLGQPERQNVSHSTPSYSSTRSSAQDPERRTVVLPPLSSNPSALGASSDNIPGRTASYEAHRNASAESPLSPWHSRLSMSSSYLSTTTANSPTVPTSPTSSHISTPGTLTSPFGSRDCLVIHNSLAARKVRKPE